jgi:hypothetical protein
MEPFNPNGDGKGPGIGKAIFPSGGIGNYDVDSYVQFFKSQGEALMKGDGINIPPSSQSFVTMSMMPDMSNSNIIQWVGVPPESLAKIASENIAPQMIIGMRIADILSYANLSNHPWKKGWRITHREADKNPTKEIRKDVILAENFILNCNTQLTGGERDARGYTSFRQFLAALTRDTLIMDGMAVWTDRGDDGKVQAFKTVYSGNIRLAMPGGYMNDPSIFAVAVDQSGTIITTFTRDELVWYVRNPRSQPDVYGYGLSELQIGVRLIQGFQNAFDMNADTFQRNHVPNGMLLLKGVGWVQRQLDILTRVWNNMAAGISKRWQFPALVVPKDGDLSVLDLSDIRGKEAYYMDYMNLSIGAFCTVYRFPPHRLGYKASGKGPDSEMPNQTAMERIDEEDIGKEELLDHIELMINEYLLSSRFPHLRFEFTGKNQKQDAREYEERQLAMTMKERRANVGLSSLEDAAKESKDEAIIAVGKAMDMAPIDPGVAGIFQALISSQGLTGKGVGPEGRIDPKIDPAESELHGGISGVRRDSAAETKPKP